MERPTDAASAREALLHVIHQQPRNYGYHCVRWTLAMLRQACSWLHVTTDGGMAKVLHRLGIRYKLSRDYVRSPDEEYLDKVAYLWETAYQIQNELKGCVLLYLDEVSFFRQPTGAHAYEEVGHHQPLARRCTGRTDTKSRVVGALNALTGQVHFHQASHIKLSTFIRFLETLRTDYAAAKRLFIVLDNWPLHFHEDVLAVLEPQLSPFAIHVPTSWRQGPQRPPASAASLLPIQLLPLPSYASWLNPIEKLWRYLKQTTIHLHEVSHDWDTLKQQVNACLAQFSGDSPDLLRYVGLAPS